MSLASQRRLDLVGLGLAFAWLSCACESELVVGKKKKAVESGTCSRPDAGGAGAGSEDQTIDVGWSTGFENGFCDYQPPDGFCYADPGASYEVVTEPVPHGGSSSAAFSVTSNPARNGTQTRCVRVGTLPPDAVYGAWLYLPSLAENTGNWNLFHFLAAAPGPRRGLWDVSLGNADDGSLFLYLFDFLNTPGGVQFPDVPLEVPIGAWFHVEFRLRRAADATGEVALYQDGVFVMGFQNVITDDSDSAEWFVGNLATVLTPPDFTVYVNDVSVSAAPP